MRTAVRRSRPLSFSRNLSLKRWSRARSSTGRVRRWQRTRCRVSSSSSKSCRARPRARSSGASCRKRRTGKRRLRSCLAAPHLVTGFPGDQPVANVEVVQQAHVDARAHAERAVFKAIADDAEVGLHVIEDALRGGEALDVTEADSLCRGEQPQVHLFDLLPADVGDAPRRTLPDRILGIELEALVDSLRILFVQMHLDEI